MTTTMHRISAIGLAACVCLAACEKKVAPDEGAASGAQVVETSHSGIVSVEKPERFSLVAAGRVDAPEKLSVTGTVFPDVSREVPVISLANGRVVDIKTRLDDNVTKGQLLFRVQSNDVTAAFDTYLKAVNDEQMNRKAYLRAQDLFNHGAISAAMLEQADDAENDAKADLVAADEQLKLLGLDKDHPTNIVDVHAPISGVIIAQNVTNAAAAGVTLSGSATAFTIADLSSVWILCDVYENDLPKVRVGQEAKITLSAYPDKSLTGRISDIAPVLDPSLRTAKVRIQVSNPGILRLGMFVTATFTSRSKEAHAAVPADAVLHLHDRDWIYEPAGENHFRRVEVRAGDMLPGNRQEILSGIDPGQQVVTHALLLETAGNQ